MLQHKLILWFIFPLLISGIMFYGGATLIGSAADQVEVWTNEYLQLEPDPVEEGRAKSFWNFWETCKEWINAGSSSFLKILSSILLWLLMAIMMKYVLLILMSPVLAFLSEKVEEKLTGNSYPFRVDRFIKDVLRGVLVALRNFFFEFGMVILIWSLFWSLSLIFPIVAPITIIITVGVSAYYYGFSMIDYVNERRRLSMGDSARFVRAYKGIALAIGIFIVIGMKVPLLGFIFASFASMLGAVAAVTVVHERIDLRKNEHAVRATEQNDSKTIDKL